MVAACSYGQAPRLALGVFQCHQGEIGCTTTQVLGDSNDVGVFSTRQIVVLDVYSVPVHDKAALPHHLVLLVSSGLAIIDNEYTSRLG